MLESKILVVDDDTIALDAIVDLLRRDGHEVHEARSTEEAEELLHRESYHLVITDVVMPGRSGVELTRIVHEALPATAVVVVSGRPSLDIAVTALKAGAADYLAKPVDGAALRALASRLLAGVPRYVPNRLLAESAPGPEEHTGLVARSPAMRAALQELWRAAAGSEPVLLRGPPGCGKRLCARLVHDRSTPGAPFVAASARELGRELLGPAGRGPGGTARGRVALARGGTLYVSDVDAADPATQESLVLLLERRLLEPGDAGRLDVRIVAGSARDLGALVAEGRISARLQRLLSRVVELPGLERRREDVPELAGRFVEELASRHRKPVPALPEETLELLASRSWQWNVAELQEELERAVIRSSSPQLGPELFAPARDPASIRISIGTSMREVEREVIRRTLDALRWNKNRTSQVLGISRRSLYNKLERYQIVREAPELAGPAGVPVEPARPPPLPAAAEPAAPPAPAIAGLAEPGVRSPS